MTDAPNLHDPTRRRFAASAGEKATLAVCLAFMAVVDLFILALAAGSLGVKVAMAAILAAVGLAIAGLCVLVADETAAAFRLLIEIDAERLSLRLPARRGLVRLAPVEATVPLASIERIESREEAFRQIGVAAIQQAWRLKLKDGSTIPLGADRPFKGEIFSLAATEIAARARVSIVDLGMVDGSAGILAAVGTGVPDWTTPALSEAERVRRVATAARAYRWIAALTVFAVIARLIGRR